jgi:NAD(P)-dependent dehydrogenase (short-subunit alcohol dehydrogenase family)
MVTGATSGIGLATAQALAERGATVVLVGRNAEKGSRKVAQVRETTGNAKVSFMLVDLSVQEEIRQLARKFENKFSRLDVLVNNVGGFFMSRRPSADGIEMTWALNYLGVFLLTHLLLDLLQESAPARIVNVSSDMHRRAELHLDNLGLEGEYSAQEAYGQAKLALMLFTFELARRLAGTGVTVNAVHPGFVATELWTKGGTLFRILGPLLMPLIKLIARSPEEGAQTVIYLAASPEVKRVTGRYFVDKEQVRAATVAYDLEVAQRLWDISVQMAELEDLRV